MEITSTSVVLTLEKRAHDPYLVASGLTVQPIPMPWFGNKKLVIGFAWASASNPQPVIRVN